MKKVASRTNHSRREFLRDSLAGVGAFALSQLLPGCAAFTFSSKPKGESLFFVSDPTLAKSGTSQLCVFNPASRSLASIPVPLELAHGCFANPGRPELVFAVEQSGPRACMVNLATREVRSFSLDADRHDFYGHGLFLNGGDFFVTTEVNRETKEGRIAVRRSDTLKIEETIPSYGKHPHDIRLLKSGTVLVIANHGFGYDEAKDQSYVVHMLSGADLDYVMFPVGDMQKSDVRRLASRARLRTATKPDSQDVCFIGSTVGRGGFLGTRMEFHDAPVVLMILRRQLGWEEVEVGAPEDLLHGFPQRLAEALVGEGEAARVHDQGGATEAVVDLVCVIWGGIRASDGHGPVVPASAERV